MMAMLFMLEQRIEQKDSYPLLSCSDVISLLCHFLPQRTFNEEEVFRQLEVRHRKRKASIKSAYRRQQREIRKNRQTNVTK